MTDATSRIDLSMIALVSAISSAEAFERDLDRAMRAFPPSGGDTPGAGQSPAGGSGLGSASDVSNGVIAANNSR